MWGCWSTEKHKSNMHLYAAFSHFHPMSWSNKPHMLVHMTDMIPNQGSVKIQLLVRWSERGLIQCCSFTGGSLSWQLFANKAAIRPWLPHIRVLVVFNVNVALTSSLFSKRAVQSNLSSTPYKVIYATPRVSTASYSHVYLVHLSGDQSLVSLLTTAGLSEAY